MAKLFFTLFALLFTISAQAREGVLSSFFLPDTDPAHLKTIAKLFEIEHRRGTGFEVQVPEDQAALLLALAPNAQLLESDVAQAIQNKLQMFTLIAVGTERYHSFDEVQAWMHTLATAHPDLAKVVDYGASRSGHALTAIHIGTSASLGKPIVMITAATHGDELITTEVLMNLVDRLVNAYHKEDRLTKIMDSHDLYFIPVVNPDGFTATRRFDGAADPNRSYPYPEHESAVPTPSIAGVMKFFSSLDVKASIDFHAYGELIMYPWAYTHSPVEPAAHARFDSLTKQMAESNRYTYGPISDVIYVAPGSSADYYFWKKGTFSLGIEIGSEKIPSPSEFPAYFASQEESTWRFIEGI